MSEELSPAEPPKRKRGRPKGAKNKRTSIARADLKRAEDQLRHALQHSMTANMNIILDRIADTLKNGTFNEFMRAADWLGKYAVSLPKATQIESKAEHGNVQIHINAPQEREGVTINGQARESGSVVAARRPQLHRPDSADPGPVRKQIDVQSVENEQAEQRRPEGLTDTEKIIDVTPFRKR